MTDSAAPLIWLTIAVVTLVLDVIWLTFRGSYHLRLFQSVQGSPLEMRILPAVGVYLLLPTIVYLAAVKNATSLANAAQRGAITGLLIYAFYDLTNYATLNRWTLHMTVTDILWGTLLCCLGASAGYFIKSK